MDLSGQAAEAAVAEHQEASDDALMTRIGQAVMLLHGGDREEARHRFGEIWTEIGEVGDALHRCTLAHYMADTQDDPGDELAWDLRALTAAEGLLSRPRAAESPVGGWEAAGEQDADVRGPVAHEATADRVAAEEAAGGAPARDGRAPREVSPAVRAFYPSLHLNLAADYLKLQQPEPARLHLDRARAAADALADDGYGNGVRAAIERLEWRLRPE